MDTPVIEFRPWSADRGAAPPAQIAGFILIVGASALAVMLFAPVAALALAVAAILLMFARLAYRSPQWRIFALLLIVETLPSANFIPVTEAQRPLLRYPLYLLFCAPMLPRMWRGSMLSRGGFRLYAIYFAWALLSVCWSLVPAFSLGRALSSALLFVALCSIAAQIDDDQSLQRIIRYVLLACAVLTAIIAATALMPGFSSAWVFDSELGAYRLQGMFDSPNQVGEVNMITIGAALACWHSLAGWRQKMAAAILIAVSIVMMAAADSRSAAVAIVVSMAALAVWRFQWRGAAFVILAALLVLFAAAELSPHALLYLTRNDVATLTGRTGVMHFSVRRLMENPLLGFGFGSEGQIFQNRYFPSWDDLWTQGPRIPIHNGYLSRAVGLGLPAAILWAFLFLRPFAALFIRRDDDAFGLRKPVVVLLVLPVLILYLSETLGGDCRYPAGIVSTLIWAVAEKQRLRAARSSAPRAERSARFIPARLGLGRGVGGLVLLLSAAAIVSATGLANASAFKLHVPCTTSHDCPRGAFCRHETSFRGQCIIPPQSPFGVTGARQVELPPQSDPPEHLFGSMPILRCSQRTPCPEGFVCARYGSSRLQEALCVPYSEPCWSTADCSPADICDKPEGEFSLTGVCRAREDAE